MNQIVIILLSLFTPLNIHATTTPSCNSNTNNLHCDYNSINANNPGPTCIGCYYLSSNNLYECPEFTFSYGAYYDNNQKMVRNSASNGGCFTCDDPEAGTGIGWYTKSSAKGRTGLSRDEVCGRCGGGMYGCDRGEMDSSYSEIELLKGNRVVPKFLPDGNHLSNGNKSKEEWEIESIDKEYLSGFFSDSIEGGNVILSSGIRRKVRKKIETYPSNSYGISSTSSGLTESESYHSILSSDQTLKGGTLSTCSFPPDAQIPYSPESDTGELLTLSTSNTNINSKTFKPYGCARCPSGTYSRPGSMSINDCVKPPQMWSLPWEASGGYDSYHIGDNQAYYGTSKYKVNNLPTGLDQSIGEATKILKSDLYNYGWNNYHGGSRNGIKDYRGGKHYGYGAYMEMYNQSSGLNNNYGNDGSHTSHGGLGSYGYYKSHFYTSGKDKYGKDISTFSQLSSQIKGGYQSWRVHDFDNLGGSGNIMHQYNSDHNGKYIDNDYNTYTYSGLLGINSREEARNSSLYTGYGPFHYSFWSNVSSMAGEDPLGGNGDRNIYVPLRYSCNILPYGFNGTDGSVSNTIDSDPSDSYQDLTQQIHQKVILKTLQVNHIEECMDLCSQYPARCLDGDTACKEKFYMIYNIEEEYRSVSSVFGEKYFNDSKIDNAEGSGTAANAWSGDKPISGPWVPNTLYNSYGGDGPGYSVHSVPLLEDITTQDPKISYYHNIGENSTHHWILFDLGIPGLKQSSQFDNQLPILGVVLQHGYHNSQGECDEILTDLDRSTSPPTEIKVKPPGCNTDDFVIEYDVHLGNDSFGGYDDASGDQLSWWNNETDKWLDQGEYVNYWYKENCSNISIEYGERWEEREYFYSNYTERIETGYWEEWEENVNNVNKTSKPITYKRNEKIFDGGDSWYWNYSWGWLLREY